MAFKIILFKVSLYSWYAALIVASAAESFEIVKPPLNISCSKKKWEILCYKKIGPHAYSPNYKKFYLTQHIR